MKTITWLHLSDLHFCSPKTGWEARHILKTLQSDLKLLEDNGLHPDLIFFTGDAAYGHLGPEQGKSIESQLIGAKEFFEEVRGIFSPPVSVENFFIVPGNHDVNRSEVTESQIEWLENLEKKPDGLTRVQDMLHKCDQNWRSIMERLTQYEAFLREAQLCHLLADDDLRKRLIYGVVREIAGIKVGIAGFNVVWSSARDQEKGRLWMGGHWQIQTLKARIAEADITIALMHHPPNWFVSHEDPSVSQEVQQHFHFLLHGHEHQNWVSEDNGKVRIGAGACYGSSEHESGYSMVRLDLDTGKGEVWLRKYEQSGSGWIPRLIHGKTDERGVWPLKKLPFLDVWTHDRVPQKDQENAPAFVDIIPRPRSFVGRVEQLQQLDNWYRSEVPLASIVGSPGVGKSSLVCEWLACQMEESALPLWYIDAAHGFLSPNADWREYSENLLRVIAYKLDIEVNDEIELPIMALATRVRQSGGILVLDQLEFVLNPKRSEAIVPVGVLTENLQKFFRAFITMSKGTGRIILVSRLRPAGIVEEENVAHGYVTAISGGKTRDLMQLGGLSMDDAVVFARSKLLPAQDPLTEHELREAYERLTGNPKGLELFLALSRADRVSFMSDSLQDQPLDTSLNKLMNFAVRECNQEELAALRLVALLRRPEREGFLVDVGRSVGVEDMEMAIEDLRRRSLVQYGLGFRAGYDTHGVVREFALARYKEDLGSSHLALAKGYERLLNRIRNTSLEMPDFYTAVEVAYHFYRAGEMGQAVAWRDRCTELSVMIGREAYFSGDHKESIESASALIESAMDLVQTQATPYDLSRAYFYRAVNQHRIGFDWNTERADLRKALELDPLNTPALTFSISFIYGALKARIHWSDIQIELSFFVDVAHGAREKAEAYDFDEINHVLIRLLCLWGDRSSDLAQISRIYKELRKLSEEVSGLSQTETDRFSETQFVAYIDLWSFLMRHSQSEEDANNFAAILHHVASLAKVNHKYSARLWLRYSESCLARAKFAKQKDEQIQYLGEAKDVLEEMQHVVALPTGYMRRFIDITLETVALQDRETALLEVDNAFKYLEYLSTRPSTISIPRDEWDVSRIRLAVQYMQIDPKNAAMYLQPAIEILRDNLQDPDRWLSLEMAEQAISLLSSVIVDSWQSEELQSGTPEDETTVEEIQVTKTDLLMLDEKLRKAAQVLPSSRFKLLGLMLRVQYLRKNWIVNDPNEPRVVREVEPHAEDILRNGPFDTDSLMVASEFYRVLATRTFLEARFVNSRTQGLSAFDLLLRDEKAATTRVLYKKAYFLRSLLDYSGARQLLTQYLEKELHPYRRFFANRLFLDATAHSIYWKSSSNSERDSQLMQDAELAYQLHLQYLQYQGIEREDISNLRDAIRELQWIRCAVYIDKYKVDLSWIDRLYKTLGIDQGRIRNAHIIGDLPDSSEPILQILGTHWNISAVWQEVGSLISGLPARESSQLQLVTYFRRISKAAQNLNLSTQNAERWSSALSRLKVRVAGASK